MKVKKWVKAKLGIRQVEAEDRLTIQYIQDIDLYEIVGNGLYPDRWSSGDIQLIIHDILTVGQVSS